MDGLGIDTVVNLIKPACPNEALGINEVGARHAVFVNHFELIVVGEGEVEIHPIGKPPGAGGRTLAVDGQYADLPLVKRCHVILQLQELFDTRWSPVRTGKDQNQSPLVLYVMLEGVRSALGIHD